MPLLERLKSIFSTSNTAIESRRKSKAYNYIKRDEDPGEIWKVVGELGDGSFGKVYKVCTSISYCYLWFSVNVSCFVYAFNWGRQSADKELRI